MGILFCTRIRVFYFSGLIEMLNLGKKRDLYRICLTRLCTKLLSQKRPLGHFVESVMSIVLGRKIFVLHQNSVSIPQHAVLQWCPCRKKTEVRSRVEIALDFDLNFTHCAVGG